MLIVCCILDPEPCACIEIMLVWLIQSVCLAVVLPLLVRGLVLWGYSAPIAVIVDSPDVGMLFLFVEEAYSVASGNRVYVLHAPRQRIGGRSSRPCWPGGSEK